MADTESFAPGFPAARAPEPGSAAPMPPWSRCALLAAGGLHAKDLPAAIAVLQQIQELALAQGQPPPPGVET